MVRTLPGTTIVVGTTMSEIKKMRNLIRESGKKLHETNTAKMESATASAKSSSAEKRKNVRAGHKQFQMDNVKKRDAIRENGKKLHETNTAKMESATASAKSSSASAKSSSAEKRKNVRAGHKQFQMDNVKKRNAIRLVMRADAAKADTEIKKRDTASVKPVTASVKSDKKEKQDWSPFKKKKKKFN